MGIDKMEPPPPSKPRMMPMPMEAKYPRISIRVPLQALIFYYKRVRKLFLYFRAELLSLWSIRKLPQDQPVVLNALKNFHLHRHLFLIGVFKIIRETHKVDKLLVRAYLNAVSFWRKPGDFKIIELIFFNRYM